MTDLRDLLSRTADAAPLASTDLAAVQRRARTIRRRRATTATGGAVAAAAVIAGVGIAVAPGGSDHAVQPAAPSVSTPATSASPSPGASSAPSASTPNSVYAVKLTGASADQTYGGEPPLPVWSQADGGIDNGSGTIVPLATRPVEFAYASATKRFLVIEESDQSSTGYAMVTLDTHGKVIGTPAPTVRQGIAVDREGDLAWITGSTGGPWALFIVADGHQSDFPIASGKAGDLGVTGILSDGSVVLSTASGGGEIISMATPPTPLGFTSTSLPGFAGPATESGDLVAVQRDTWSVMARHGDTWAVVGSASHGMGDVFGGDAPVSFSPNGQQLLVGAGMESSVGPTVLRQDTLDFASIATFQAPQGGSWGQAVWSGDTVVALLYVPDSGRPETVADSPGTWTLVWLSPDGYQLGRSTQTQGAADAPPMVFGLDAESVS